MGKMLQSKGTGWLIGCKKKKPIYTLLLDTHLRATDSQTRCKGLKKDILYKWKQRKAEAADLCQTK